MTSSQVILRSGSSSFLRSPYCSLSPNPATTLAIGSRVLGTDLGLLFLIVFVFGHHYYPHIKSSWGGGAPVAVTIYFSKDSVIKPSESLSAELVEESDEGYYIVGQKDSRAVFVPRNAVSLLYFSDSVSDSSFLPHK